MIKNVDGKVKRELSARRRNAWFINQYTEAETDKEKYYPLSAEERKEIASFWAPYEWAHKNDERNQWLFSRASGRFDPSYIGFGTQRFMLVAFWNHPSYDYCRNKNNAPYVFPGIKFPETVLCNNYGYFQDKDRKLLSLEEAVAIVFSTLQKRQKELVIKPSAEGCGEGVGFLDPEMSVEGIADVLKRYKSDFIIQKLVKNHKSISELYPDSLNTFRVSSLQWKGKVYYNGAVLRVGCGERVDNAARGGIFLRVFDDGRLSDYAMNEQGHVFYEHPITKVKFKGRKIPNFNLVIEIARKAHEQLPQQRVLSLDVALDQHGAPIVIETNSPGGVELLEMFGINIYHNKEIAKEIFDEYLRECYFHLNDDGEFEYREFADHVSIVKYKGNRTICKIPNVLGGGKPVTRLYKDVFKDTPVQAVEISRQIFVEEGAFVSNGKELVVELT